MKYNSSTGQEADGINIFRHSHDDQKFPNDSKYKSHLFLDQIQQIIYNTDSENVKLSRNDRKDFLKPETMVIRNADKYEENQKLSENRNLLDILLNTQLIPRKPKWHVSMDAKVYEKITQNAFKQWKEQLEGAAKKSNSRITRYEYNLNVWKQFWLVIERSEIIAQVVDSRDPFAYICPDIVEICEENQKQHILVLNKCDLLNEEQKELWKKYMKSKDIKFIFWSTFDENNFEKFKKCCSEALDQNFDIKPLKIGFVGYPNVGKSSTINSLTKNNSVAESATPGKTKTLQSILIDKKHTLFDCPGMYIPKFFTDSAKIALLGIYPADAISETVKVVQEILKLIPAYDMSKFLNIDFNKLQIYDAESVIELFGLKNRFLIGSQRVDRIKSSKVIMKKFMNASILFCRPPPDYEGSFAEFNNYNASIVVEDKEKISRLLNALHGSTATVRNRSENLFEYNNDNNYNNNNNRNSKKAEHKNRLRKSTTMKELKQVNNRGMNNVKKRIVN